MKLYYSKGACSLAVRIILNEINIPFEQESVDLKTKKTETGADYYLINPKGAVPALKLKNQDVLTENAVIQQYLADEYKATTLLPPLSDPKRYHVLEWLNYVSTELHKGFGPLFNNQVPQQIKDDIFIPILKNKFNFIEKHLTQNKFLMAEQFTLPDAYLFVMLFWLHHFKIDLTGLPRLARYYADLKNRQAIQKSLKEERLEIKD